MPALDDTGTEPEGAPQGVAPVEVVEVHVSESEFRVYEALGRLLAGAEFWCGSQDTLAAEADYDKRTVRTATRRLEARGLVRMWAEPGRALSYVLIGASEGRPFVVRRRGGQRQGRDVVRSARPVGLAQSQIDALLASLAEPGLVDAEGRIEGADQGGGSGRITTPDRASVLLNPSMSSSSSSIRPLPPIRPSSPPPPPPGEGRGVEASPDGDGEPLPEGWESVTAALVAIDVDPEPWLVRELASAPDPWVWREAVRAAHEHDAETPLYVSRCFATALRRWERLAAEEEQGTSAAGPDAPQPSPVVPAVTVRAMANPQPMTLREVLTSALEAAQAGLVAALKRKRR